MFRKNHSFSAGQIRDGKLFFSDNGINGLFSIDLSDNMVSFLGVFEGESPDGMYLHRKCLDVGDKLFFLPESANGFHIFNPSDGKMEYISLGLKKTKWMADACEYDGKIYMFPHNLNVSAMIYDTHSGTLYKNEAFEQLSGTINQYTSESVFFSKAIIKKENIYLPLYNTRYIIKYSCKDDAIEFIDSRADHIFSLYEYSDGWLIYTTDNELFYTDCKFKTSIPIKTLITATNGQLFTNFIDVGNGFIAVPKMADNLFFFDKGSYTIHQLPFPQGFAFYPNVKVKFWGYNLYKSSLFLFPQGSDHLLKINVQNLEAEACIFPMEFNGYKNTPFKEAYEARKGNLLKKGVMSETSIIGVEGLIELIN